MEKIIWNPPTGREIELSKSDLKKAYEEKRKKEIEKAEEYDAQLREKSKPYSELVQQISGTISKVKGDNYPTKIYHLGKIRMIGGSGGSWKDNTGYTNRLEITLDHMEHQGRIFIFDGNSIVESGNRINLYIFAGEKVSEKLVHSPDYTPTEHFIPRELSEIESVLYLEKLRNGKVVRTDYSVNCPDELKR